MAQTNPDISKMIFEARIVPLLENSNSIRNNNISWVWICIFGASCHQAKSSKPVWCDSPEVGTNNIISKAQRNKAQRSFQPVKVQRKMRSLIFLISEAQCNFRNELFDSVEAKRNFAIVEQHFRTKLKCNGTSAIKISHHNANTAFFAILD